MPTMGGTTTYMTASGSGGDGSQWGPCPPGSLMERQELGFDVRIRVGRAGVHG